MPRVAVVTGANKGIGYEIVKSLLRKFDGAVYLTSRDEARGLAAVGKLKELGLQPVFHILDVANRDSVMQLRDHIKVKYGGIDILVNNAAIAEDDPWRQSYEESKQIVDTNYFSLLTIQELLFPLLRENARVVNISSDCGHLSNIRNEYWVERLSKKDLSVDDVNQFVNWYLQAAKKGSFDFGDIADGGSAAAYRVAKVGMSALTVVYQRDLAARGICINSVNPGLVRTDMTLGAGFLTAEEAAETPVWLALEAPASLRGAYVWYDRRVIDWYDHRADYFFKVETLITMK